MKRHIFDGRNRVAAESLDPTEVMPWTPPAIAEGGKLVYAEPRDVPRAEAQAEGAARASAASTTDGAHPSIDEVAMGRQEGFALGLEEGRRQGREESHEEGYRAGHQEGRQAGHAEGLQQGAAELRSKLSKLDSLLTHLTHALNEQDYQLEQALFNLVKQVAGQVIQRELSIDDGHIMQIVRQALQALPPSHENVRILVHPNDQALVMEAAEQEEENWRVIASADVSPGGCRVETEHSLVDFTVEQRFAQVIEHICAQRFDDSSGVAIPATEEAIEQAPEPVTRPLRSAQASTAKRSDTAAEVETEAEQVSVEESS